MLSLLDLSAAFDTIDHDILLDRLKLSFGIRGKVLEWFGSYIKGRTQSVVIDKYSSNPILLNFGVPQGSVLGPILFSLYSQPLSNIIRSHQLFFHQYADDTQLYTSVCPTNISSAINSLSKCVTDVSSWMSSNKLKLNESKTEIILIGTTQKLKSLDIKMVDICGEDISISTKVRNLGVIMDSNLTMAYHISNLRKLCYLELRKISYIRKYITIEATNKLICSFVLSRLDYCNSLHAGITSTQVHKLQQIQNSAARLIMQVPKREHITPTLELLHWLPIKYRILYKIASLVYQCLYDPDFPSYLKEFVYLYKPQRTLRSANKNLLLKPRFKLKTFGTRTFSFQAAEIWNTLPDSILHSQSLSVFKNNLKTYFYNIHYC